MKFRIYLAYLIIVSRKCNDLHSHSRLSETRMVLDSFTIEPVWNWPNTSRTTSTEMGVRGGRRAHTGWREMSRGKLLSERETGSGAELQCQWKRSWMPVGGSTLGTIDPQLSQDA